ncbi:MAG: ornithine carbamoyltransferase [Omnitrophica WOR_2 bacterium GWA2_47_8]|nr:MAG: ornithine carbamoyltransferase [Omnitrophica WOR_2 bacterium GWA2_47_8]
MSANKAKRDLLSLQDLTSEEVLYLFELTEFLKKDKNQQTHHIQGHSVGLLFQKPSNRTRVSFEVGIAQLGGNCIYLGPEEINLGKRESVPDVAKTLSRYLSAIVARTNTHKDLIELGKQAAVPVINGLSDLFHPCQALADLFSIKEKFGKLQGLTLGFIGDGNNVSHSLLLGCAKVGMNMKMATPKNYEPDPEIFKIAQGLAKETGAKLTVTKTPEEAAKGADVIYADVWVSMGQEKEEKKRLEDFNGYQINKELVKHANKDYIFMHCLPAHRGQEVTEDVIDNDRSIIFDQAENRMHVQKAVLVFLLNKRS